ncbi:S9 family peptidase [Hyphococcus flavus]|uniref:S9 family peptidase n=1 Tax=Hyphococcus flavus TaxID=1866326 RepID=A0AAF0CIH4_9PROT|nr:S9 family peptidase [Hyphococcus flavus]WDI32862.1 S9 family peptidase [Hyphococcus flavus]
MKKQHLTTHAAILCSTVLAVFSTAANAQQATPEQFGAMPAIATVDLSPDGDTLAALQTINGERYVVFTELEKPDATPQGVGIGAAKAHRLEWAGDNHVLLLTSVSGNVQLSTGMKLMEFYRWIAISADDRNMEVLFQADPGAYVSDAGSLSALLPNEPDNVIMARWNSDARISSRQAGPSRLQSRASTEGYSLFDVNLNNGRNNQTFAGEEHTSDWVVEAGGEPVLRIDYDETKGERKIFRRREGSRNFDLIKTIQEEPGAPTISFYGMGKAPNRVITSYYTGDKRALVSYDINEAQGVEVLFQHEKYDFSDVIYDPVVATAIGVRYTDDFPRTHYLDLEVQSVQDSLDAALPDANVIIDAMSADGNKMVVRAVYPDRPDEIYIFDQASKNLAFYSSVSPAVADRIYATKSKFDYVTEDGLTINGYLTVPAGADKENLPLIVLPHGGPESRDDQSYDYWSFFYAARGYAVYQPNFRGSHGYGFAFRQAGFGEWGRKMQDDITNGVQKLITDGVVDPGRICIAGASYGGYAALAGATLTPDLYQCAVSVNGVADLPAMLGQEALDSEFGSAYWERRIGSRFRDTRQLEAVSPTYRAGNATAPIMLIHSKDDTVVPFYQSQRMAAALTEAGKPYEFIELEGEDHWLSFGPSRIEVLRQSINFIDQHIGD